MNSVVRVKQILGKVDVDLKCDICNVSENIQEYFQKHGIAYHMRNNMLVVNF